MAGTELPYEPVQTSFTDQWVCSSHSTGGYDKLPCDGLIKVFMFESESESRSVLSDSL